MASSDEEFVPSDIDEEAFLHQAYGTDEEGYLQGATTGGACRQPRARAPGADSCCRRRQLLRVSGAALC